MRGPNQIVDKCTKYTRFIIDNKTKNKTNNKNNSLEVEDEEKKKDEMTYNMDTNKWILATIKVKVDRDQPMDEINRTTSRQMEEKTGHQADDGTDTQKQTETR